MIYDCIICLLALRHIFINKMTSRSTILLFLIAIVITQDPCADMVESWITNATNLQPITYADSGKFLNDLGDYNNCLFNSDAYMYFTMSVVNRLAGGLQNMGLCAPIECSDNISANAYSQQIQDTLNEAYQSATNSTFVPFVRLNFFNPEQAQPVMDWSNYVTIAFLLFLVLLGVLGSVLSVATKKQNMPIKIIKCFSLYDNITKIFSIPAKVQNENLLFLNGARVLSIFWIVFGHDSWFRFMNIRNWIQGPDILQTAGVPTIIPAAYFAVDMFFWIGGFLITMGMMQQMEKVKKFWKFYFGAILHRFIRIWPTYMVAILVFWKVAPYFGSGPLWPIYNNVFASACNDGGVLWNMFFIDNFGDHGPSGMDYCFGWGWYLAVDFQLFLVTPFIMYAYHRNKKLGWLVSFILFMGSIITAFAMIMANNWRYPMYNPALPAQPEFMDKFYYKPYIRASAYMMGIFSGFIYVQWKNHDPTTIKWINYIKNNLFLRIMLYVIGIGLCQASIWIIVPYQQGETWSTLAQAFYNALNRVFFLIGMYMCIFAGMFGCRYDPSRQILGHWFFSPLAKVSFCIYLTHFIVIVVGTFSSRSDLYWQTSSSLYNTIFTIFLSIIAATALSALVQVPILGLQKIFLRPSGPKKSKEKLLEDVSKIESPQKSKEKEQVKSSKEVKGELETPLLGSQNLNETLVPVSMPPPVKEQENQLL